MTDLKPNNAKDDSAENNRRTETKPAPKVNYIAVGLAVGVAIGVALNNLSIGIALGIAVGAAIGAITDKNKAKP